MALVGFQGGCRTAEIVRISIQRISWTSKPALIGHRGGSVSDTHANTGMVQSSLNHH